MKTPMRRIKRLALALCLATPVVSWASTTYSTDHTVTGSGTEYTTSAGNANITWQNFNFRAAVDKDHLAHGYYFYLTDRDTDIGETDVAVKLDSITVTWGSNAGGDIGADDTPYLVVTTPDDSPVIIGVSNSGDKRVDNGTSTFTFTDVALASNAKYRFYFYKNDVSSLSVGATLSGAVAGRVNGRYHNTSSDARADYNDIRCSGGAGYSVNCSFVVSPVEEGNAVALTTAALPVSLNADSNVPVVIEGTVEDGVVEVGSDVDVSGVLTVCGTNTTLELTDSLEAAAFYFPATVTIDASAVSGLDPTGDAISKTTELLIGAMKYTTAPTVILPTASEGMIYETSVTGSGISVTVVKGVDCVETIAGNTSWSAIKPVGWVDAVVGDKPAIAITYEGEEPVTLTFDETVQAGSLTLTGNIVVEASAAATFGTVNAGAGSVVEMANMTIATQSGAGTYRYRSGYPGAVPYGRTYEYVGGATDAETVVISGASYFNNEGTLKTSGFISFSNFWSGRDNAILDVLSGKATINSSYQKCLRFIVIRQGAEMVNARTSDALAYGSPLTVDVYGTLSMGQTRWTVGDNNAIKIHGGTITGVGEGNNGALDFIGTGSLTADADSTIFANVKFRNALSNVTVSDGVTLTISGATKQGYVGGGITKKGAGTLKFTSDPYVPGGIVVEAGTLAFDTQNDVDPVVTYTAAVLKDANMDYVDASNWKGTVIVSAVAAGDTATQVALNKTGNANSYLTLNGISGDAWCAGSNYTVQPAITLAGDVNFQNGSSGKTVTFRKIASGSGNLSLKSWSGCTGITYGFTTIDADNYTGTIQLDGSVLTFNVGDILKAGAAAGDKVLPLTVTNNATVNLVNAKLNGEAANLVFDAEGDDGSGIYVRAPVTYVAQVGETKYETVAAAADVAWSSGKIITLLANAEFEFVAGDVGKRPLKIALNGFTCDFILPGETYALQTVEGAAYNQYSVIVVAARVGDSVYGTVYAALADVVQKGMPVGTVVTVVDSNYDPNSDQEVAFLVYYFRWRQVAKTFTRIATVEGEGATTVQATTKTEAENSVTIIPTDKDVLAALNGRNYAAYFTKTAVETSEGSGVWTVTAELNRAVVFGSAISPLTADTSVEVTDAAVLDGILDDKADAVVIPARPGLYYSFKSGDAVTTMTEGDRVLANGESVELDKVAGDTFYQVLVNTAE